MALVTYLIRAVPFVLANGNIENKYIRSFLAYVPYAVLASMTFPAIFYSTGNLPSGIAGSLVALFFSYKNKGLLFVAISASLAAFLVLLLPL